MTFCVLVRSSAASPVSMCSMYVFVLLGAHQFTPGRSIETSRPAIEKTATRFTWR